MAIRIADLIRDIVYDEQSVIIPGLGMVISEYRNAEIDHRTNRISPPHYAYIFDDRIVDSDGRLAETISKKHFLSVEKAEKLLKKYADQINENLKAGKSIVLPGLGKLAQNSTGKIELMRSDQTKDPYSEFYPELDLPTKKGFPKSSTPIVAKEEKPSFSSSSKSEQKNKIQAKANIDKSSVGGKLAVSANNKTNQDKSAQNKTSSPEQKLTKKKKRPFIWVLLAFGLLGFLACMAFGLMYLNSDKQNSDGSEITKVEAKEQNKGNSKIKESDGNVSNESKIVDCAVVVGIFSSNTNVAKLSREIEDAGYEAHTVNRTNGTQLGIVTDCNDYKEILDYARKNIERQAFLKKIN